MAEELGQCLSVGQTVRVSVFQRFSADMPHKSKKHTGEVSKELDPSRLNLEEETIQMLFARNDDAICCASERSPQIPKLQKNADGSVDPTSSLKGSQ